MQISCVWSQGYHRVLAALCGLADTDVEARGVYGVPRDCSRVGSQRLAPLLGRLFLPMRAIVVDPNRED